MLGKLTHKQTYFLRLYSRPLSDRAADQRADRGETRPGQRMSWAHPTKPGYPETPPTMYTSAYERVRLKALARKYLQFCPHCPPIAAIVYTSAYERVQLKAFAIKRLQQPCLATPALPSKHDQAGARAGLSSPGHATQIQQSNP
jgi:hypothetical protein